MTPRDEEVCRLLLKGYSNAEMAEEMGIATRTVKTHFNRIFLRLGIRGGDKRVKLAVRLHKVLRRSAGASSA